MAAQPCGMPTPPVRLLSAAGVLPSSAGADAAAPPPDRAAAPARPPRRSLDGSVDVAVEGEDGKAGRKAGAEGEDGKAGRKAGAEGKDGKAAAGAARPAQRPAADPHPPLGRQGRAEREGRFEELWARQVADYAAREEPIKVRVLGEELDAVAWKDTPADIAKRVGRDPDALIVARVDEELWDLSRPLEGCEGGVCHLELLDWGSEDARHTFWHSSAHVLGAALEEVYGALMYTGPAQGEEKGGGFFYDAVTNRPVKGDYDADSGKPVKDYKDIDTVVRRVASGEHPFQRLVIGKQEALQLFGYNEFKVATLSSKVEDGGSCIVYRCGQFIDPCRGPHVPNTSRIKAFKVHSHCSAENKRWPEARMQRVYGMSFPEAGQMKEWEERVRMARELDHRKLGEKQDLFMFHPWSPGSAFWFPRGARIYNKLCDFIRKEYRRRGFEEVMSPNMYSNKLFQQSGHSHKYADSMFELKEDVDGQPFALKPMNCPGHCLMFRHTRRSVNELPIRYADFGVLHRNELSGALGGLTRVRRFCQDDAHIFCTEEQVTGELRDALGFVEFVYGTFGFSFHLALSTRPAERIGDDALWDMAEAKIRDALNAFCGLDGAVPDPLQQEGEVFEYMGTEACLKKVKQLQAAQGAGSKIRHVWRQNPGDGAFYGPKIDIRLEDAMGRLHQLGTVQLDFNLPSAECFDLSYDHGRAQKSRPVMIHRAILGSLERCIAILAEHWGGRWPFWLSPRQAVVVPVSREAAEYARQVRNKIHGEGYDCDLDDSGKKFQKKIAVAQEARYNFILVVGADERGSGTVSVRSGRDAEERGRAKDDAKKMTVAELLEYFARLCRERPRDV